MVIIATVIVISFIMAIITLWHPRYALQAWTQWMRFLPPSWTFAIVCWNHNSDQHQPLHNHHHHVYNSHLLRLSPLDTAVGSQVEEKASIAKMLSTLHCFSCFYSIYLYFDQSTKRRATSPKCCPGYIAFPTFNLSLLISDLEFLFHICLMSYISTNQPKSCILHW